EQVTISCPIIFTTAYDEFALKAFEVNSIDYILKPIDKRELSRAIQKFKNFSFNHKMDNSLIEKLWHDLKQNAASYKSCFLISKKDKLIPLSVNDIATIYIEGKSLGALTFSGNFFILDGTLDDWMEQLDPQKFYRANRQYIISRKAVKDISIWFGGKLSVNLSLPTPERIIVSKARTGEFKKWFMK
ncbi:MAG: LytTR family DNA-binding domain-containing protein, partial [Dysgonamonadaceae bacterium]|nr:LytTR family DNA-binding domain-containing protein [Dysgonamonadaceae bacterium]